MLYREFIDITGWDESYMTYEDYTDLIEPIYNKSDKDKHTWCKALYKAHTKCVNTPVEMAISALCVEDKLAYIEGDMTKIEDVTALHNKLKATFLRALQSSAYRKTYNI